MLHLLPQHEPEAQPDYAEAVSRLASVRHALRLVDGGFAAGPADDLDADEELAAAWPQAGEARHRWFDRRSARLVETAATGIEALLSQRQKGREPHRAASETLVGEIRRELREVAGIVLA
ncbi:hypothetical protein [Sphingomonas sp.]|uniref:hypothetical protein n=1 Tax=Sphingomonas sp. TaxID=28214 RepID=UPI00389FCA57